MKRVILLSTTTLFLSLGCAKSRDGDTDQDTNSSDASPAIDSAAVEQFDRDVPVYSGGQTIDVGVEKADGPSINDVLDECGIDDLSDLKAETFSTVMHYKFVRVINAGIAVANVPLTSILDLSGTLEQTTLDVGVEVDYEKITGTSELANVENIDSIIARADQLAKRYRGPAKAVAVPLNSNFGGDWKGVLCAIIAADRMENLRDGAKTITEFNPPFPPNISPIADRIRYEEELGDLRHFRNIEAHVIETTHPDLKTDQIIKGSATVEKIANEKWTPHGTAKGDIAYRVSYRFGTDEQTLAMGFHLWTEFYLDLANHSYSAVIANVGDVEIMHFYDFGRGENAN